MNSHVITYEWPHYAIVRTLERVRLFPPIIPSHNLSMHVDVSWQKVRADPKKQVTIQSFAITWHPNSLLYVPCHVVNKWIQLTSLLTKRTFSKRLALRSIEQNDFLKHVTVWWTRLRLFYAFIRMLFLRFWLILVLKRVAKQSKIKSLLDCRMIVSVIRSTWPLATTIGLMTGYVKMMSPGCEKQWRLQRRGPNVTNKDPVRVKYSRDCCPRRSQSSFQCRELSVITYSWIFNVNVIREFLASRYVFFLLCSDFILICVAPYPYLNKFRINIDVLIDVNNV